MYPQLAEYFRGKSVLIVGFGREGQSTFRFLRKYYPDMALSIADKNEITPPDACTVCYCGENYLQHINDFDLVMKSPGISFKEVEAGETTEITKPIVKPPCND